MVINIYCSNLNTDTLEWEKYTLKTLSQHINNDDNEIYEVATFNEDGFEGIYAESLISQEEADRLVLQLAERLRDKFQAILDKHR